MEQLNLATSHLANAIRILSIDAVQQAKSGHPGAPMGMAEIAEVVWRKHLKHNPAAPDWVNRDRFVLSNGHGSMLIYALLHLTGYDLPLQQIKAFRQFHSKTPGHPEVDVTPGVETTTGPLGQGLANAVGMAIAEKRLAAEFNRPGFNLMDHRTWVFAGDGCLMEGISHEVCSLAGTLQLGKLNVFYDDNGISIDGEVDGWFTDDTAARFRSYGWHVVEGVDGHDSEALEEATQAALAESERPSLLICKTVIGKGSPNKQGTHGVHGAPLGEDEVIATRESLGWQGDAFEIPEEIYLQWDGRERGAQFQQEWDLLLQQYRQQYPEMAAELDRRLRNELPGQWETACGEINERVKAEAASIATRKASQGAIEELAALLPEFFGGSADLTGSNLTNWSACRPFSAESPDGNYLSYGVREFGMAGIMNGMALHGGVLPFGGTFLTFSDYSRNAVRMAALMDRRVIHVFTHDSIGLGEDGPTHQPVEHVSSLRLIPNLEVWRPADTLETAVAWQQAVARRSGPTALILSRQSLPFLERGVSCRGEIQRGGYCLIDSDEEIVACVIATGSEVQLAVSAQQQLSARGIHIRVVSMPNAGLFLKQSADYQQEILPAHLPRVAIEAGSTDFWYRFVGLQGRVIGIDRFGESAPAAELFAAYGITADAIIEAVVEIS